MYRLPLQRTPSGPQRRRPDKLTSEASQRTLPSEWRARQPTNRPNTEPASRTLRPSPNVDVALIGVLERAVSSSATISVTSNLRNVDRSYRSAGQVETVTKRQGSQVLGLQRGLVPAGEGPAGIRGLELGYAKVPAPNDQRGPRPGEQEVRGVGAGLLPQYAFVSVGRAVEAVELIIDQTLEIQDKLRTGRWLA